jgi:hypothetical protein
MKTYQINMPVQLNFTVFEFANSEQEAKEKVLEEHFKTNASMKKFLRDYLALCGDNAEIDDSEYWEIFENPLEKWHSVFKSMNEKECA